MSMMVSFVLSFFPRDVLDEILNLIGSVSEGFPSYSYLVHSEINRYNQPYQIISRIVKFQSFVINIINLFGALYLISIKCFGS